MSSSLSPSQEAVYQLSLSALRETVLEGCLEALESQVSATPPSRTTIAIATELSLLYLVLLRRWSHDLELRGDLIGRFDNILKCCSKLECSDSVQLCVSLYSILILLLKTLRHNSGRCGFGFRSIPAIIIIIMHNIVHSAHGTEIPPGPDSIHI